MSTPHRYRLPAPPADSPRPVGGRGRGKSPRAPLAVAAGLALAAAAGFATRGLWLTDGHPAAAAGAVPVAAAAVVRTDLSQREVVAGTLGYLGAYSVIDESGPGIVSGLAPVGGVVRRGGALCQLAGQPVTLLYGQVPAWRAFGPGMTPGPDVRELQRNLRALGFDPGPADGQFGWSTQAAVERWQQARGLPVTGTVPLGQVAFLPGPLRVTSTVPLGTPAAAGTTIVSGTSDSPGVTVSLTVGGPVVKPGDPVLVTLPDGTTTVPGRVASVGRVATPASTGAGNSGSGNSGAGNSGAANGGAAAAATVPVTITIGRPALATQLDLAPVQVEITQQLARNVLAVPVTALLAEPGGSFAIRVSGPAGRLIPVSTGIFDDATGLVEVSGTGLAAGQSVQAAGS